MPLYLSRNDITTITWDVEPNTYLPATATPREIADYVTRHVRPGSIILLHPWSGDTNASRDAVPLIIDDLYREGFRFATVSELLQTQ